MATKLLIGYNSRRVPVVENIVARITEYSYETEPVGIQQHPRGDYPQVRVML